MKKRHILTSALAILVLVTAPGVWAQPYSGYGPGFQSDYHWREQVNLTAEQQEKIDRLQQEFYKETDALKAELDDQYRKLDELEMNPAAARSSLDKTWDRITELQNSLDEKWESHQEKIRDILTPEQRQRLDSLGYGYGPGFIGTTGYGRGGGGYYRGGRGFPRGGSGYYRNEGGYLRRGRGMGAYPYGRSLNRGRGFSGNYAAPGRGLGLTRPRNDYRGYQRNYRTYNYGIGPCGRGLGKWYNYRGNRGYGWRR